MISSKVNDLDRIQLKQRYLGLKKHYQKLNEIKISDTKQELFHRSMTVKPKAVNSTEKILEINRVNQILLSKLKSIQKRKPETVQKSMNMGQKTLNSGFRKQIAHRILEENELIANRILSQRSQIVNKKLQKDYLLHQKYKNQLSKKRMLKLQEAHWARVDVLAGMKSLTPTILQENEKSVEKSFQSGKNLNNNGTLGYLTSRQEFHDISEEYSEDFHS